MLKQSRSTLKSYLDVEGIKIQEKEMLLYHESLTEKGLGLGAALIAELSLMCLVEGALRPGTFCGPLLLPGNDGASGDDGVVGFLSDQRALLHTTTVIKMTTTTMMTLLLLFMRTIMVMMRESHLPLSLVLMC
jgi:hypothetical protein